MPFEIGRAIDFLADFAFLGVITSIPGLLGELVELLAVHPDLGEQREASDNPIRPFEYQCRGTEQLRK